MRRRIILSCSLAVLQLRRRGVLWWFMLCCSVQAHAVGQEHLVLPHDPHRWEQQIHRFLPFVNARGLWGYQSPQRRVLIRPHYQFAGRFSEGLAVAKVGKRFGYIDTTGAMCIPAHYEFATAFLSGCAFVRQSGLYGVINRKGSVVIAPKYDELGDILLGKATVVGKSGKYGLVTASGVEILAPQWSAIRAYTNATFVDAVCADSVRRIDIDAEEERVTLEAALSNAAFGSTRHVMSAHPNEHSREIADAMRVVKADSLFGTLQPLNGETLDALIQRFARFPTPEARLYAVFLWVREHICCQQPPARSVSASASRSMHEVFTKREGTPFEVAKVVQYLAEALGIKALVVQGWRVAFDHSSTGVSSEALGSQVSNLRSVNHAWNVVRLPNGWGIVDATTSKQAYFLPVPEQYIQEHFPRVAVAQLLDKPVSKKAFVESVSQRREHEQRIIKKDTFRSMLAGRLPLPKAEVMNTIRAALIDQHARHAPDTVQSSLQNLAAYLQAPTRNDAEKVRAVFCWIHSNVQYDADGVFGRALLQPTDAAEVLHTKRTACDGYANLTKELLALMGVESWIVRGNVKGIGYVPNEEVRVNHAWNIVQIDERWYCVDATWGSGHINDRHQAVRSVNEAFFLTDPEQLINTHFPLLPASEVLQLLPKPITAEEFQSRPRLSPEALRYGVHIEPLLHTIRGVAGKPVHIAVTVAHKDIEVIEHLFNERGNGVACMERKYQGNRLHIIITPPAAGRYEFKLLSKPTNALAFTPEMLYELGLTKKRYCRARG